MDKQEFDKGYNAAIEAIKNAMKNGGQGGGQGGGQDSGLEQPQPPQGGGSGGSSGSNSRDASSGKNRGKVTAADCTSTSFGADQPNVAGTFGSRDEGQKLAEQEGYTDSGPGDDAVAKSWGDAAIKNSSKLRGNGTGNLKSRLDDLWKTSTDWKKKLRDIIGRSLNPEDRRQAYAQKNILVSQDRIARTDKDKYDNLDYIACFIDSSGSMSDDQLRMVLSEVLALAQQKKPMKLVTIQCDTQIQEVKEYYQVSQLRKEYKNATVKGRGGTELKPCWDFLRTDKRYKGKKADIVLVFTDGCLTQYKRDTRTMSHLFWCFIDNSAATLDYQEQGTKALYFNAEDIK